MSDVARANALLQAAGVTGVEVRPADEKVSVSCLESGRARVAAAAQPEIGADALPEGAPAQVQALAQEQAANATPGVPPTGLPGDILPLEEVQRQEREGAIRPGMSHAERMAANEGFAGRPNTTRTPGHSGWLARTPKR